MSRRSEPDPCKSSTTGRGGGVFASRPGSASITTKYLERELGGLYLFDPAPGD